ncbi:MAG: DUF2855 family protein [Myxococcota bacterium]
MIEPSTSIHDFAVRRDDYTQTGFFERPLEAPSPDQVIFRVDRYALTANNISYATAGDMIGYWRFFPAEDGWGRLPCFAFADVVGSNHDQVREGDRYFGYFPMSTHLVVDASRVKPGSLVDDAEHRRALPAAYNQYTAVAHDPFYDPQYEDAQMLLKPLFMTSFLIDDFLAENSFFGAKQAVITSASSKTSIALAFQLRSRSLGEVVGLTSARNRAFVERLGFYDRVATYEEVESLDAAKSVVAIDMAGNAELTRRLHEHFGQNMAHDCLVGGTHWTERGRAESLPGAKPEFFFAPAQIQKRSADWGPQGLFERIGKAWLPFATATDQWLEVRHGYGHDAVSEAYEQVVRGNASPEQGHVLSLWPHPDL